VSSSNPHTARGLAAYSSCVSTWSATALAAAERMESLSGMRATPSCRMSRFPAFLGLSVSCAVRAPSLVFRRSTGAQCPTQASASGALRLFAIASPWPPASFAVALYILGHAIQASNTQSLTSIPPPPSTFPSLLWSYTKDALPAHDSALHLQQHTF